jgi:hypothetical protein
VRPSAYPYKTTGKTTVLYTLIFVFLDSNDCLQTVTKLKLRICFKKQGLSVSAEVTCTWHNIRD